MATIQTTQLEERETGDIKQLRDHDIAEGPVSTNSADATSLKSVPLTLEDGSIIKVRFDSLVTAIGQALGASEDSTVTKVLGLNGTVPKGIGMANLASVLGDHIAIERNVVMWKSNTSPVVTHTCLGKPIFVLAGYNFDTAESAANTLDKRNLVDYAHLYEIFLTVNGNTFYTNFNGYQNYDSFCIIMDIVYLT